MTEREMKILKLESKKARAKGFKEGLNGGFDKLYDMWEDKKALSGMLFNLVNEKTDKEIELCDELIKEYKNDKERRG